MIQERRKALKESVHLPFIHHMGSETVASMQNSVMKRKDLSQTEPLLISPVCPVMKCVKKGSEVIMTVLQGTAKLTACEVMQH